MDQLLRKNGQCNETPLQLARTPRSSQDKDRYKAIEKMLIDAGAKE
jgi:hypothetical protein